MKMLLVALTAATLMASVSAQAQNAGGTVGGAAGGAAVGAVVGGPVGAVVGGAAGAIVGSTLPPQPSVSYQGRLVEGEMLPETYTYYPVPEYDAYSYAVVNSHRVIVDRHTHKIVRIID